MYNRRVALFVLKDKDRILLQKRSKDDDKIPNYWAFFGGQIEEGESPEQAVKREAKEELGIVLEDFKLFKRYELQTPWGLHENFVFVAPLKDSLETLRKQQTEGQGLDLFSFKDIEKLKITDTDRIILKDLFGK